MRYLKKCVLQSLFPFFENRHFLSHRPPMYDVSKILCVDKIGEKSAPDLGIPFGITFFSRPILPDRPIL